MPLLRVTTNQEMATSEGRGQFLRQASAQLADLLGKPERYCMVNLETGACLLFGGTDEPAVFAELTSLGLPTGETERLSAALCDLFQDRLGVDPVRVYVHFQDVDRSMWGTNRTTFG